MVKKVEIGPLADTFPLEVEAVSGRKLSINFYRNEIAIVDSSGNTLYSIGKCTSYSWKFVKFPLAIPSGTRIWRLTKTGEKIVIHCNGEKVLEYVFSESSYNPGCSDNWEGDEEGSFYFAGIDYASSRFRS